MVTKEIVLMLNKGDELEHLTLKRKSDGLPVRCRVNGKCKTWKTRPEDFRLPVKHGLYEYFYITPSNASEWQFCRMNGKGRFDSLI